MILGWVPKWKPKGVARPPRTLIVNPQFTDTKLAVAVSPIPSSDGRYRPTSVIQPVEVPARKRPFRRLAKYLVAELAAADS